MATVFGDSGPKGVEALEGPARQSGLAATAPNARRASVSSEEHEKEQNDQFANGHGGGGGWKGAGTWSGGLKARTQQLIHLPNRTSAKAAQRWMSQNISSRTLQNINGRSTTTSQRFSQPLASEGKGSVFPIGLPLAKRRGFEVEIIQRFDRLDINTHVGEFWFFIDAGWMTKWVEFVLGKTGPPGPISNINLYNQNNAESSARRESMLVKYAATASARNGGMAARPDLTLKPSLQKLRDYRAVHPLVWYIFREIYTTDESPDLCRWKADVYSDEVDAARKFKLKQETHVKAVYELRRFCGRIKNEMKP